MRDRSHAQHPHIRSVGVTRNELTRKTQFIRRNMREEYLADLIDGGEVVARDTQKGGVCYFLQEYANG